MVLNKILQSEHETIFIEAESLWMEHVLSQLGEENFRMLKKLPSRVLEEMRGFIRRNSLAVVAYRIENKKPLHCCCSKCLKAHLIKRSNELHLSRNVESVLNKIFDCDEGHESYYLDGGDLVEI